MRRSFSLALLLSGVAPTAVFAQTAPAPPPAPAATPAPQDDSSVSDEPDIIVTGSRNLPGSVIGDIPPEQQLGPADIRSYGVSSVSDLLTELAPQTTSGRGGAPVVLLNGRRISSFAEIRDLPTEAIARVDILPEEVALKYGYRADQKVVNFVLRRRFRALTAEVGDKLATEGGVNTPNATLDIININRDTRLTVHTGYTQSSMLLESERDIAPIAGNTLDERPFRSLLPFTRSLNLGTVYARPIGKVSTTLNGTVAYSQSNGLQGFSASNPTSSFVIGQRNTAITYHLGSTANGDIGAWRWSLTSNYDRVDSQTFTDADTTTPGVPAANRGFSTSNTGEVNALFNGKLFTLPAGNVSTSIRVGGSLSRLDSRSSRFGITQSGSITRNVANGQINVDVPIASKSKDVLAFIGDLSLNGNFALDSVSDFGTLKTIGYGLNWSPIKAVRVIASMIDEDAAPSASQLGDPVIVTPNVRIFDFTTGQTVSVSRTAGGNPFLLADSKHSFKLGLTLKPLDKADLTLTASYVKTSVRNAIASFPAATAQIEAAFPSRFTRDANGNLTAIDARPVNFARTDSSQLRWGINFSKPIKSKLQKQIEAFRAGTGPDPRPALAGLRNLGNSQSVFGGTLSQGFRGRDGQNTPNNPPTAGGPPPADGSPPPANATGGASADGQRGGGGRGGGGGGGGRFGGGGAGGGGGGGG
ncbi:MAG: TonB-dependent receptor, partial [Sphingomonas bacterium]|nr:TonB-dependent receptor [Sphingomonas bacterium]